MRVWALVGLLASLLLSGAAGAQGRATAVLALSWEPEFCLGHRQATECQRETAASPEAHEFSLHGLWPEPRGREYCGVDPAQREADQRHDWAALPEPELSAATRARLGAVMPGLASGLERHEWVEHGTCFGGSADAYFARETALAEQVNAAAVRTLFEQNIGRDLSADAIRAAFDQAFGAGAGARVVIACWGRGDKRRISELRIYLAGDVAGSAPIGALIQAAPPVRESCPGGKVAYARRR